MPKFVRLNWFDESTERLAIIWTTVVSARSIDTTAQNHFDGSVDILRRKKGNFDFSSESQPIVRVVLE